MGTIKAVKMVRRIRDASYTATKNMNNKELIRYFSKKAESVNDEIAEFIKTNSKVKHCGT
jgi:hypothetical protein